MLVLFFIILLVSFLTFMCSFNKIQCVQGGRHCGRMGDLICALKGPNNAKRKEKGDKLAGNRCVLTRNCDEVCLRQGQQRGNRSPPSRGEDPSDAAEHPGKWPVRSDCMSSQLCWALETQ